MGLTERHWFEDEDVSENYEWALEDAVYNSRATEKVGEVVIDRENVISNFEHEVNKAHGEGWDFVDLNTEDAKDILILLKAQKPRVLTKDEIIGYNGYIWKEYKAMKPMKGVFINHGIEQIPYEGDFVTKDYGWPTYQKLWRCWSAQPTEEQRETAPWNEPPKEGDERV